MPSQRTLREILLTAFFFLLGGRIIYFDACSRLQCTQNLVTASNHFITLLQAFGDFYVGGSADSGVDGDELGFVIANYEHALNFFFLLRRVSGLAGGLH